MVPFCIAYSVVQLRLFYYVFCMKLIRSELKYIDQRIELMFNSLDENRSNTEQAFSEIRRRHQSVHKLALQMNGNFNFSHVAATLSQFHLVYGNTNWLYIQDVEHIGYFVMGKNIL